MEIERVHLSVTLVWGSCMLWFVGGFERSIFLVERGDLFLHGFDIRRIAKLTERPPWIND